MGELSRFAVVAFAPEGIVEDLRKLRATCPRSGRVNPDCHVTVRRGWSPPYDEPAVQAALTKALAGYPAFSIRTREAEVVARGDERDVLLPLEHCEPLERLNWAIDDELAPMIGRGPRPFTPHVTVVERVSPEGAEQTLKQLAGWRVNYSWVVRDVDIIGLDDEKLWRSLGHFSFGKP